MNKQISNTLNNKLGEESIAKLLWSYSLPAIVGTMVSSIYNIIGRIFIGQGVGPLAISGLALTFPFMNLLFAFGMLIGVGSAARVSISLGENDNDKANKIVANSLMLNIVIMGSVIIISRIFMTKILLLFGGSANTVGYAEEYMKIIIPTTIINTITFSLNNVMRGSGYPKKAMYTMFISAVVNLALAPIFIFWFDWGVAGAALATVAGITVSGVWVLSHFFKKSSIVHFERKHFKFDKEIVSSILSIGMSPFTMQIAMSIVVVIINQSLMKYGGDLAVGALGIQNSIMSLIVMFIVGINQGAQPIFGFNYGAGKNNRVIETLKLASIVATVVSIAGFLISQFIPHSLAKLFTNDEQLIQLSADALRISMIIFPLVGSQIVITTFFQSIGKAKISIFLSLTRQVLFLIPSLIFLPPLFGLNGVWASMPLADALAVIVTTITLIVFLKKYNNEYLKKHQLIHYSEKK